MQTDCLNCLSVGLPDSGSPESECHGTAVSFWACVNKSSAVMAVSCLLI